jgi:hypothetical protein
METDMKIDPLERLYNRNYGLPNSVRRKILDDAEATTVRKAAEEHKVGIRTIYLWRRHIRAYALEWNDCVLDMTKEQKK